MITAEWFTGDKNLFEVHAIRRAVFIEEQGVSEADELDGTDGGAIHLLIRDGGAPVATGRITIAGNEFTLGRIAVLKERRGEKLGSFTVRMLIRRAFELGGAKQHVHSQTRARGFYEKLGFTAVTDEYTEAGIPHVGMVHTGDAEGCA